MPYCPNCGAERDPEDRFCSQCGDRLPGSAGGDRGDGSSRSRPAREGTGGGQRRATRDPGRSRDGPPSSHGGASGSQATPSRSREAPSGEAPAGDESEGVTFRRGDGLDVAFSYPVADGYAEVLKGGVLVLVSFLVVPLIVLGGYGIALGKAAARGEPVPPDLERWGELLVDGLKLAAVGVVTGAVVGGVLFGAAAGVGAISEGAAAVVVFAGYVLGGYAQTAVVTVFAGTGSLRTALTSRRALDLALTDFYAKAFLKCLLLGVVLTFMVWLSAITIVGWLFAAAYAIMATGAFWGYTYHEAAREGIVPRVASADDQGNERRPLGEEDAYW